MSKNHLPQWFPDVVKVDFARTLERELSAARTENERLHATFAGNVHVDNQRLREEKRKLEAELVEARAYADTLAAGLPDGMLPADVENLRKANGELAQHLAEMTQDRDKLTAERDAWKAAYEADARYQRELRADRDRLDWLATHYGSSWTYSHLYQHDVITRTAIDAAMGVGKEQP